MNSPTKKNVRCLMNFILENATNSSNIINKCFEILLSAFIESQIIAEQFVTCDGLQFMEKCLKQNFLNIDISI